MNINLTDLQASELSELIIEGSLGSYYVTDINLFNYVNSISSGTLQQNTEDYLFSKGIYDLDLNSFYYQYSLARIPELALVGGGGGTSDGTYYYKVVPPAPFGNVTSTLNSISNPKKGDFALLNVVSSFGGQGVFQGHYYDDVQAEWILQYIDNPDVNIVTTNNQGYQSELVSINENLNQKSLTLEHKEFILDVNTTLDNSYGLNANYVIVNGCTAVELPSIDDVLALIKGAGLQKTAIMSFVNMNSSTLSINTQSTDEIEKSGNTIIQLEKNESIIISATFDTPNTFTSNKGYKILSEKRNGLQSVITSNSIDGNGISTPLEVKLSTDVNNKIIYGSDGGIYTPTISLANGVTAGLSQNSYSNFEKNVLTNINTEKKIFYSIDFITVSNTNNFPFQITAISTGITANNNANITENNPGILRVTSSANINSGARVMTDPNSLMFVAGMEGTVILNALSPNGTIRAGFLDTTSSADATDGIYIEMIGSTLNFKTSNNNIRSSATPFTTNINLNTWYKMKFQLISTSLVRFTLYNNLGVLLETKDLTTNIPIASNRLFGFGVVATNTASNVQTIDIDYMDLKATLNR
jgi:hypothetical protein